MVPRVGGAGLEEDVFPSNSRALHPKNGNAHHAEEVAAPAGCSVPHYYSSTVLTLHPLASPCVPPREGAGARGAVCPAVHSLTHFLAAACRFRGASSEVLEPWSSVEGLEGVPHSLDVLESGVAHSARVTQRFILELQILSLVVRSDPVTTFIPEPLNDPAVASGHQRAPL